jgi:hypothetical protein
MRAWRFAFCIACCAPALADDPPIVQFRALPVRASGDHEVIGNTIVLQSGHQVVWIDFMMDDWDPAEKGTRIKAYQLGLAPSNYSGGVSGSITQFLATCSSHPDCATAVGPGSTCNLGAGQNPPPTNTCTPGFITTSRPDYLFMGVSALSGVDLSAPPAYRFVGAPFGDPIWITRCNGGIAPAKVCATNEDCPGLEGVVPPGTCEIDHGPRYLASLALYVSPDAAGTFTVRLRPSDDGTGIQYNNLIDGDNQFIPVSLAEARIRVVCTSHEQCQTGNPCMNGACVSGRCTSTPNYNTSLFCCRTDDGTLCPKPASTGDTDNDGDRDMADAAVMQECFQIDTVNATCAAGDYNCDCLIDASDYAEFANELNGPTAP